MEDEKLKKELKEDYPLIPMKDITDEARLIAVVWMECSDKKWIGQKHKLASDIINYARRHSAQPEERTFTLQGMIEAFESGYDKGMEDQIEQETHLGSHTDKTFNHLNAEKYFKSKFNIEI